jgi:hypothetical protein
VDELIALRTLVTQLSPSVLIAAHVFRVDTNRSICISSSNRCFEITDGEIAAIASSGTILIGVQVSVMNIMFCTRDWLRRNYDEPLARFPEPRAYKRCFNCLSGCFHAGFPINSRNQARRSLASRTLCLTILFLIYLIGLACCHSLVWIEIDSPLLDLSMIVLAVTIVEEYLAGSVIRKSEFRYVFWFSFFIVTIIMMGFPCISGLILPSLSEEKFQTIWLNSSNPDLREKIENHFECCGWQEKTSNMTRDCLDIQLCRSPVMSQVNVLAFGLGIGFGLLIVTAIWTIIRVRAARKSREYQEDS